MSEKAVRDSARVAAVAAVATTTAGSARLAAAATTAVSISSNADSQPDPTNTIDRRSLRSRRMMHLAATELIDELGLNGFTVSDLMERADLNRSTFYGHYSDLDDLIQQLKVEIVEDLSTLKPGIVAVSIKDILAYELTGKPPAVTSLLFDILREHGRLLRGLLCQNGDAEFQAVLRDEVCANLIRSILHKKYTQKPSALVEYYIRYYSSALLGIIQLWLENGMVENSNQMARIMLSIMFLKPGDPIKLKGEK